MRYLLFILMCLAVGPIAAETIGNVEYHLPNQGQGWKVADELTTTQKVNSTTIVYVPENEQKPTAKEFFAAHVNNLSTDLSDVKSLEKGLEKGGQVKFPDSKIKLTVLDVSPQSALYEYSLMQNGNEKVHGWIRAFANPQQTVLLTYQTESMDKLNETGPSWVQALKEAKIVQ